MVLNKKKLTEYKKNEDINMLRLSTDVLKKVKSIKGRIKSNC